MSQQEAPIEAVEVELGHEVADLAAMLLIQGEAEPMKLHDDARLFLDAFLEDLIGTTELQPAVEAMAELADDLVDEGCPTAAASLYDAITRDPIYKALMKVESTAGDQRQRGKTQGETVAAQLSQFCDRKVASDEKRAVMHDAKEQQGGVKLRTLLAPRRVIR